MARIKRRFKKKRSSFPFFLILLLLLAGAGGYIYITYFEGEMPQIASSNIPEFIGNNTPFTLIATDKKSGLRSVIISISQNDKRKDIFNKEFQRQGKDGVIGTHQEKIKVILNAKTLHLKEGKAVLNVEVTDHSFRGLLKGNRTILSQDITIDTKPPRIAIIHSEKYIKPGGAGIVIYRVDDQIKHGVMLNEVYYPGFPLADGTDSKFISYIALPYTADEITKSVILAEDAAGNRTVKPFAPILQKANQKKDRINVGDGFLSRKIPEFEVYYPEMEGTLVQKYLYANRKVRTMNNKKIHDLCMNPELVRLWSGKFIRMAGSSKAGFADHRTYYYKGEAIDKQVHLGMDIASTPHVPIKAAGTGKVIFADYLGIYGNMVMLDHGQGVVSLYSHLSQINVAVGDTLSKGDILGNSGKSGMAGGDHLHFSMLVNGIFVTPKEWWDQHWIDVTIEGPLADAKF